jgi:Mg-chelatase subunit ChlD
MKTNYTEIAFILDRSGSMESCQDAAIEGFNDFLHEQQQAEGLAKLTLVLFDSEYLVPVQSLPVQEVIPLTRETYVPRSMTALLDAIARTVDEMGARFAALLEEDRPVQVIVSILTDGLENASQNFGWEDVAERIKHQTDVYKWTFLFLGANQDAIATAAKMNIAAANSASYVADEAGSRASHRSVSRKTHGLRAMSLGIATREEQLDAAAPLSDIVQEEDRKERGENT